MGRPTHIQWKNQWAEGEVGRGTNDNERERGLVRGGGG